MPRTKKCKVCGTRFEPSSPVQRFCNILCQQQARKDKLTEISNKRRKCRICKRPFTTSSFSQLYCSSTCSEKARIEKAKAIKTKRPKLRSLSLLKKDAWSVFSLYIRRRDCIASSGDPTYGNCFTCGESLPIGKLQAGHFVDGRTKPVLFHEDIVHSQCYKCNIALKGAKEDYTLKMLDLWGTDKVREFLELRHSKDKIWKREELLAVIEKYREKLNEL